MEARMVIPAEYPELRLLAWSRDPATPITDEEALSLYEASWRQVDRDALCPGERRLIEDLTARVGGGHFLATR
jgi:hypothetical protein